MNKSTEAFIQASAGAVAGIFSTIVLYPLDSIKTRIQANDTKATSVREATHELIERDGFLVLYRGMQIKTIENGIKNFLYFYCYDYLINHTKQWGIRISPSITMVLGYVAGLANIILISPLEVVGTRQQAANASGSSLANEIKNLYKNEGLAGFYRGFIFNVILCINPAIQNTVFDNLKLWHSAYIRKSKNLPKSKIVRLTILQAFVFGALAKLLATLVTYPLIARKTRIQVGTDSDSNEGFFDKHYRGLGSAALKTILQAALMYMAKDQIADNTKRLIATVLKAYVKNVHGIEKIRATRGRAIH